MNPTRTLIAEHEVILKVLECLERLAAAARADGALDAVSAEQALEFLKQFADRCHHGKEEGVLFPMLHERGLPSAVGPVAVMLAEHAEGRERIGEMSRACLAARASEPGSALRFARAAQAYVALLRDHIAKENEVLFPMADEMLGEAGALELERRFQTIEHEDLGPGVHERYLELARALCRRFGIDADAPLSTAGACCGHRTPCDSGR